MAGISRQRKSIWKLHFATSSTPTVELMELILCSLEEGRGKGAAN